MEFDEDKIDEYTLALLYLVSHEREKGLGARAWKGFDWDTLNRLHEKGYLANPIGKAKSVGMSEEGFLKSKELFERHFVKKGNGLSVPKFTADAKRRWEKVPESAKKKSWMLSGVLTAGPAHRCTLVKGKYQKAHSS